MFIVIAMQVYVCAWRWGGHVDMGREGTKKACSGDHSELLEGLLHLCSDDVTCELSLGGMLVESHAAHTFIPTALMNVWVYW